MAPPWPPRDPRTSTPLTMPTARPHTGHHPNLRRRRSVARTLTVLAACAAAWVAPVAWAQAGADDALGYVRAIVSDAAIDTGGRSTATVVISLENLAGSTATLTPVLALPEGWRSLLPPVTVSIPPGAKATTVVPVVIPARAEAGEYEVRVEDAAGVMEAATIAIHVPERRAVSVRLMTAPHETLGDPFDVTFEVVNEGNVAQRVVMDARASAGSSLELHAREGVLGPGEALDVNVTVTPPADLERPGTEIVALRAVDPEREDVGDAASTSVEMYALGQADGLVYHTLPFRVTLSTQGDARTAGSAPVWFRVTHVSLDGGGPLRDGGAAALEVHLDDSLDGGYRNNRVSYDAPGVRVDAGDVQIHAAGALDAHSGFGVEANLPMRVAGVAGTLRVDALLEDGRDPGVGVDLSLSPSSAIDVTLAGESRAGGLGASGAVALQGRALGIDLGASVAGGLRTVVDGGVASRLEAAASARSPRGWASVAGDLTSAGFGESERATAGLAIQAQVPLPLGAPVWARVAYGGRRYEREDGAGLERWYQSLDLALEGRPTNAAWGVSYAWDGAGGPAVDTAGSSRLTATATLAPTAGVTLHPSLGLRWGRDIAQETDRGAAIGAGLGADAPLAGGRMAAGADVLWPIGAASPYDLTLRGEWSGELAAGLSADLGAAVSPLSGAWNGSVTAQAAFAGPMTFQASVDARGGGYGGAASVTFATSLSVPFDLAVGLRASIGSVRGRLLDERGAGVAGAVMWLAGYSTVTAIDGTFSFPAIPEGRQTLALRSSLPVGTVTLPASPLGVTVEAGAVTGVELRVVRLAAVHGRVMVQTRTAGAAAVVGSTDGSLPLVSSLLFELAPASPGSSGASASSAVAPGTAGDAPAALTAPALTAPALTAPVPTAPAPTTPALSTRVRPNDDGTFDLTLPPGLWRVRVLGGTIPEHWRLTPSDVVLDIVPGAHVDLDFTLEGVTRTIQFTGGGSVGLLPESPSDRSIAIDPAPEPAPPLPPTPPTELEDEVP